MLRSLKAKFIVTFGLLIVLIFLALGIFMINAKERELVGDIATSTQNFSRFASESLVESYENYLAPGNFLAFNRDVSGVLRQNNEINSVVLMSFSGEILFDSSREQTEQYEGPQRKVEEGTVQDRIQSNNASLLLEDGRTIFVKINEDRSLEYVDFNENEIAPLNENDRIKNIFVPYGDEYAVQFDVTYEALQQRLILARNQILGIAGIGLLLTLMLAYMLSVSITNPLKDLKEGALKLSSGDFKTRVPVRTKDELGVLAGTFNQMAQDLEASTEARVYKERVQKELELATQIQMELLPQDKLVLKSADIAGGVISATEVGGDAFDYIPMKDGRFLAYLADVTGHGVPAGILSSIANAMLYGMRQETDPVGILGALNDVLIKKTSKKLLMTMALILWDESREVLTYVSAGHPAALLYQAKTQEVRALTQEGMALGLIEDLNGRLQPEEIALEENDVVVLYSDGIPEAENTNGQAYGIDRLKGIVQEAGKHFYTAESIKNAILADANEHLGSAERKDDMTVLVLKRKA